MTINPLDNWTIESAHGNPDRSVTYTICLNDLRRVTVMLKWPYSDRQYLPDVLAALVK